MDMEVVPTLPNTFLESAEAPAALLVALRDLRVKLGICLAALDNIVSVIAMYVFG